MRREHTVAKSQAAVVIIRQGLEEVYVDASVAKDPLQRNHGREHQPSGEGMEWLDTVGRVSAIDRQVKALKGYVSPINGYVIDDGSVLGCDVSEGSPRGSEHRGAMIRQLPGRQSLKSC
ncbi:hypothetical protein FAGAP_13405 [Fusarium agapanthi]|uniref:Uncharacterized protein n=1 Tax=Fusarium agapanthi TaxID=1803897 RepID=A0A9P5AXC9_9HYPO|nr:hypothetical protein FAGAP_13405 [Fusarium agapanthi]